MLWRILRPRNPAVADLATLAAIGYALIGGAGAAVLAKVGPMLMTDYATAASASEEAIIAAQFAVLLEVVWRSIWQFLDGILIGAWWLGIGVLIRADHAGLARLSYALAALAGTFSVLNALGFGPWARRRARPRLRHVDRVVGLAADRLRPPGGAL